MSSHIYAAIYCSSQLPGRPLAGRLRTGPRGTVIYHGRCGVHYPCKYLGTMMFKTSSLQRGFAHCELRSRSAAFVMNKDGSNLNMSARGFFLTWHNPHQCLSRAGDCLATIGTLNDLIQ